MGSTEQNGHGDDATVADDATTQGANPRDTDHPTGAEQATENVENDPPG